MSWFARSIANSLRLDDDDDDEDTNPNSSSKVKNSVSGNKVEDGQKHDQIGSSPLSPSEGQQGRGVKEDLSELTKTLTRQFWGVASFLAPPPSEISDSTRSQPSDQISDSNHESQDPQVSDLDAISGIRSDLSEIGGKFKTGISKLSGNKAVSEITKIASNFLQFGPDQDESSVDAVGVTEEVLAFARNIALHPETWLDFPLPDDDDSDDFDMSDAQQEHALAVERLAPELAALRFELCPGYMSEDCFWKIYFVLLHPRLDKQDAELLSTPQIVEARAMLTQELQNRRKGQPEPDWSGGDSTNLKELAPLSHNEHLSVPSAAQSDSAFSKTSAAKSATIAGEADFETEKNQDPNTGIQIIDKSVVEKDDNSASTLPSRVLEDKYEDDGDDWLKEENLEVGGNGGTTIPIANDEDVSFSDLEEDDGEVPTSHKKVAYTSDSSNKDAREWVQLSRSSTDSAKEIESVDGKQVRSRDSETKESNDWLDVDDIDVM